MKNLFVAVIGLAALISLLLMPDLATAHIKDTLPTTAEVLERYIEALGGRAAIENLTTRTCVGRIVTDLGWATPPHEVTPFVAYSALPDRVLIVEHGAGGMRCEGADGKCAWVRDSDGLTIEEAPLRSRIAWVLDPQNALKIGEYFPDLRVVSERAVGDRWVYVAESSELDPTHYALSFDEETGLLVGIGYYWYLQEYREVDGVLVPHRVHISRKGGSTAYIFDLIDHNLPLEETLFAAPAP